MAFKLASGNDDDDDDDVATQYTDFLLSNFPRMLVRPKTFRVL